MKIKTNRISLRGLRAFCIVAQRKSFRLAAEDLFLTPSAISHQIRSLEAELDVKLFDRGARDLRLTEAGHYLLQESGHLIDQLDEVAGHFHKRYGQRPLRVTVQPFFATEMLLPKLSSFIDENPHIAINIDTEDQSAEKHPAQADVSIRLFRSAPKNLVVHELFRLRLCPACSPDFLKRQPAIDDGNFEGLPLIVHSKRPNAWRDWSQSARVELGDQSGAIRLETMISVARAAEQGLGVALVPLPLSESWIKAGKLIRLSDHDFTTPDGYFVVSREQDVQRAEVQVFRNWILKEFENPG
ncbi:MAG: LysR family glycine cleavage system transcriptional activator [Halioglobus sp.]|jgi:LysR family glycine cleavage system transcriptional activator